MPKTNTAVQVATKDAFRDQPDVSAGNIKVMVKGLRWWCKATNRDLQETLEELFTGVAEEVRKDLADGKGRLPLHEYAKVELQLTKILGNPEKAADFVLRTAANERFGVEYTGPLLVVEAIMAGLFSALFSPTVGFTEILPVMSMTLQGNKDEIPVDSDVDWTLMRTVPVKHRGIILRQPMEDVSRYFWKLSYTLSLVRFFMKEGGSYRRVVAGIDLFDHFKLWQNAGFINPEQMLVPDEDDENLLYLHTFSGSTLLQRRLVARRVKLFKENTGREKDAFFTQLEDTGETKEFRYGWLLCADLEVLPATPGGVPWTLGRVGEAFCGEAGCDLTKYEYPANSRVQRTMWKIQGELFKRPWLTRALALAMYALPVRYYLVGYLVAWWQWVLFVAYLIPLGIISVNVFAKIALPLARRGMRRQRAEALEAWEASRIQYALAQMEKHDRETFLCKLHRDLVRGGSESKIKFMRGLLTSADFEGYTGRVNKFGMEYILDRIEVVINTHLDFDANPDLAAGFPDELTEGQVTSMDVNYVGDDIMSAMVMADFADCIEPALRYFTLLHDAAELTGNGGKKLEPMPLRCVLVPTTDPIIIKYFGRADEDGYRVAARRAVFARGINYLARMSSAAKALRKGLKMATGQDATRFLLMPKDLWDMAPVEVRLKYRVEDLGPVAVADFGEVHAVRVLDAKAQAVDWTQWDYQRHLRIKAMGDNVIAFPRKLVERVPTALRDPFLAYMERLMEAA